MYFLVKLFLFRFSAESAHRIAVLLSNLLFKVPFLKFFVKKTYTINHPKLVRDVFGLNFQNPVGLAAGFDKNASLYNDFSNFGFGFIEIGTVTPKPQPGNPKPRLFRLIKDSAIINRMGFNNEGAEVAVNNLKKKKAKIIIGGNIGKNKWTENDLASEDYLVCFNALFPFVDYFVVNVSSPNTPNLRALQDKIPLMNLLSSIQNCNNSKEKRKPLLLKISPDLSEDELNDIIDVVLDCRLDGIVATNTTIDRSSLSTQQEKIESIGNGGLSGKPLKKKSTEIISYIHKKTKGKIPIIGVGGIHNPQDAIEKLKAGASLIQLYTGFIYEGPSIVKKINKEIIKHDL
ncbi:MAG: quinone-dependent dihydroorotate dehydrogenase [Crocinitomicaceae bacterium]|nr:quinone-dependent dihydroorotate dehydrogenase [Crocinitomicaceae bacterium]